MNKTAIIVWVIIVGLVLYTIYSLLQLNKTKGGTTTATKSTFKLGGQLQEDTTTQDNTPKDTELKLRENITASELASAIREKLNKQNVKEVNIKFTE